MESDMRKKEAEENAIAEIAGSSENNISKGKTLLPWHGYGIGGSQILKVQNL